MFHVKHLKQKYLEDVERWNKVHRLVGKRNVRDLIAESEISLKSLPADLEKNVLVDVGAGAGLMGLPWLWNSTSTRAVFIEPDAKKMGFVIQHLSGFPEYKGRFLTIMDNLENVPRETIFAFGENAAFFVFRAFSGARTLDDAIASSQFAMDTIYIFEMRNGSAHLKKYEGALKNL